MKILTDEQNEIMQEIKARIGRELYHLKALRRHSQSESEQKCLYNEITALNRIFYSFDVIYTTEEKGV